MLLNVVVQLLVMNAQTQPCVTSCTRAIRPRNSKMFQEFQDNAQAGAMLTRRPSTHHQWLTWKTAATMAQVCSWLAPDLWRPTHQNCCLTSSDENSVNVNATDYLDIGLLQEISMQQRHSVTFSRHEISDEQCVIDTDRQTDRQTDWHTDRQRWPVMLLLDKVIASSECDEVSVVRYRQTDRQTDRQTAWWGR